MPAMSRLSGVMNRISGGADAIPALALFQAQGTMESARLVVRPLRRYIDPFIPQTRSERKKLGHVRTYTLRSDTLPVAVHKSTRRRVELASNSR